MISIFEIFSSELLTCQTKNIISEKYEMLKVFNLYMRVMTHRHSYRLYQREAGDSKLCWPANYIKSMITLLTAKVVD